jgi:hypothetical protein
MIVDVTLTNAKFYDVQRKFDIVLNEPFIISTDSKTPLIWATVNDAALEVIEHDTTLEAKATKLGKALVIIYNAGMEVQKQLEINVVADTNQAEDLGATAGTPVPKVP